MSAAEHPPAEVRTRIEALRDELRRHDYHYFVEHAPKITDQQYDQLMSELRALEAAHPQLITPDSPSQRVGEQPIEGFPHVEHLVPMLSIDNTYSPEALREFDDRIQRALGDDYSYLVDPKIDGVAVSLRYEAGQLVLGATRGDGRVGDEITANIRAIRSVPLRLHGKHWPELLEVRGEIYWPWATFNQTNAAREAAGEARFANPRNATSGTLKQLDPRIVAARGLAFAAHGFGAISPRLKAVDSASELYALLTSWGIPVNPHFQTLATIDEVLTFVETWDRRRQSLDYETDGLVIKVDNLAQREELGTTSKFPRWCIAYKFAAERAQTRLHSVRLQVGKLGTITPVAHLEPVQLAGTTVQRATLHNFDQLERLDIRVGDLVTVEKAGEIIPQVIAVDPQARPADAAPIHRPTECPECGGDVRQDPGGVYLRCLNPACPAQRLERLKYFVGRDQMDIEGLGAKLVETLIREELITTYADIFRLPDRRDALLNLERMGEKSVDNLLHAINASKQQPVARLIAALNIRHIGATAAEILANHFGHLDRLIAASEDELREVPGIGPEMATALRNFFASETGRETIASLREVGLNFTQPSASSPDASGPLAGRTLVVTGRLDRYSRDEIEATIKAAGGKVTSTVSKKTDYVIAGEKAGSKLEKAQSLGVQVLSENEFEALLASPDHSPLSSD